VVIDLGAPPVSEMPKIAALFVGLKMISPEVPHAAS